MNQGSGLQICRTRNISKLSIMKKLFTIALTMGMFGFVKGQQNYNNFEGDKVASLAEWNGQMDSLATTPNPNTVNGTPKCAKYVRDTSLYDNWKFYPYVNLVDVTPYASPLSSAPKMTMKVYSSAPVGTRVEIQLGTRSYTTYPEGVHSEYVALTTVKNAWELLTFNWFQSPLGSLATPTAINKVVVLYRPNSNIRDTIYIDDPNGPNLLGGVGIQPMNGSYALALAQNNPNPATGITQINFSLNSNGPVSLKLYDVLGKEVSSIVEEQLTAGEHSARMDTRSLSDGVYYYVLRKDEFIQTRKMIISK